uniref:MABP1/WDR62 second WD40 domain-containing protein n=1 Tax=Trichobilharzia regenti TaxID=157069 RepID=A0AA85KBH7_TRIRE|nr:unnamed protein product [Trichobilharzia regenti]
MKKKLNTIEHCSGGQNTPLRYLRARSFSLMQRSLVECSVEITEICLNAQCAHTRFRNHAEYNLILSNNCAVAFSDKTGLIAHAAGCVTVLHSFENERQQFIQSQSRKAITAVDFSSDGKYLATGESGHQPMVRLWNVSERCQLAEFGGHHFRVAAVRFSPNDQYLVSIGSQEDHTLYVWDRQSGQRVASAKVTNRIYGVAFSPTGQFFVTVGVRYVRFWYLENKRNKIRETLPLHGRNAILGDMFNSVFTDVCCVVSSSSSSPPASASSSSASFNPGGSSQINSARSKSSSDHEDVTNNSATSTKNTSPSVNNTAASGGNTTLTLVVNTAGRLIQFNGQRDLDKWVDLKTSRANCISTSGSWVTVGCTTGVCLIFEAESLQFIAKLPLPHTLGSSLHLSLDVANDSTGNEPIYPDIIAIKLDCTRNRLICFYNDHSIHVWDIHDLSTIQKCRSHFYHSRGIWSIDCLPEQWQHNNKSLSHLPSWWLNDMFATCSDDGTIRFWSLIANHRSVNNDSSGIRLSTSVPADSEFAGSATFECTEQLAGIIYADPSYKYLCTSDRSSTEITLPKLEGGVGPLGGPGFVPGTNDIGQIDSALQSPVSPSRPSFSEHCQLISASNCTTTAGNSNNISSGSPSSCVRTICISPDGRHLAAGDRDGSLRVYSLETLELFCQIPAHDNEILSLNFFRSHSVPQLVLLCSASRDRMIHIFDPNKEYSRVQTISDHSGAIFSAKIIETEDGEIRLISCGMDKSLLFRILEPDESGQTAHFALEHHLVGRHSQLDATITPTLTTSPPDSRTNSVNRKRYLAVACQDRRLRIYNVVTARPVRCYRGSYTEDGFLVRCTIDPTGSIIATSGSDKQLNLFHLLTGESIATLYGHSELSLGLRFLPNLRYLISVSADSCIFVWRLSSALTQYLRERITSSTAATSASHIHKTSLGNSISYPQLDGISLTTTTVSSGGGSGVEYGGLYRINRSEYSRLRNKSSLLNLNAAPRKHICKNSNSDGDHDEGSRRGLVNQCAGYNNNEGGGEYVDEEEGDDIIDNEEDDDDITSASQTLPPSEWNDSLGEYDKIEHLYDDDSELDSYPLDDVLSVDNMSNCMATNMSHNNNNNNSVKKRKSAVSEIDPNMWGDTVTNHACKTRGQVASTTLTTSANNNSSSNNNNNGNNRNTKKPEFYFSVSALPAWARRKLSRRESVTLVPTSLSQVVNTDLDIVGSDSASQASVGSGPILPVSSSSPGSHETIPDHIPLSTMTSNKISKHNRLSSKKSMDDDTCERNVLTPVSGGVPGVTIAQSAIPTNNQHTHSQIKTYNQMSRSEYKARECYNFSQTNEISSSEQNRERNKMNWLARAVSAPDTPRPYKKEAHHIDTTTNNNIRKSVLTTTTAPSIVKTRKPIDSCPKKLYPTQGIVEPSPPPPSAPPSHTNRLSIQNRPKDLAIQRLASPRPYEIRADDLLVNESVTGKDCTNPLPLFNRPKTKSNQRSYSATQLMNTSSPTQHTSPSIIDDESISLRTTRKQPCFIDDDMSVNHPPRCSLHHHHHQCQQQQSSHQLNSPRTLRASVDFTSKVSLMSLSSSSYQDPENTFLTARRYPSQSITSSRQTDDRLTNNNSNNNETLRRSSTRMSNPTLSHTKEESNSIKSAIESLHALRVALDLAVERLAKLTCHNHKSKEYSGLRDIVSEELEWRFSRLRAMLGLSPVCVEAPVARVLLADIVERLIPELKSVGAGLDIQSSIIDSDNTTTDSGALQYINHQSELYKSINLSDTSVYDLTEISNSTINPNKSKDAATLDDDDDDDGGDEEDDDGGGGVDEDIEGDHVEKANHSSDNIGKANTEMLSASSPVSSLNTSRLCCKVEMNSRCTEEEEEELKCSTQEKKTLETT